MKKKASITCLVAFYVFMIIAILMQLGRLLNKSEAETVSQEVKEISASAWWDSSDIKENIKLGSLDGADTSQMFNFVKNDASKSYYGNTYCGGHNNELMLTEIYRKGTGKVLSDHNGKSLYRKEEIDYEYKGTVNIIQSVAYAHAHNEGNTNDLDVQQCVWGSGQFKDYNNNVSNNVFDPPGGTSYSITSGGLTGRAYSFANYAYRALNNEGNLELTETTDVSKLKIMVNQRTKMYTIGPYKIDIATGNNTCVPGTGSITMRTLVDNELQKATGGYDPFCVGSVSVKIGFGKENVFRNRWL